MTRISSPLVQAIVFMSLLFLVQSPGESRECVRSNFVVAIDVGHTKTNGGATSATGIPEYSFNSAIAESLILKLQKEGYGKSFIMRDNSLRGRVTAANQRKASLLLSIHHDSVQPQYLSQWIHGRQIRQYSDKYKGFSIFYSQKNGMADQSLLFASLLGTEMLKEGLSPSLHHAERIKGENHQLIDEKRGIYRYDELAVLKGVTMPAILIECGIIVNKREEELLHDPAYRLKIVIAIRQAITTYCNMGN